MDNLSQATSQPQDDNPFAGPMKSDDQIAMEMTGEHDSSQSPRLVAAEPYPQPGNCCGKCGVWEQCDGDNSDDGSRTVAALSSNLIRCTSCEEHAIHPACGQTVDNLTGLCPCCWWLACEEHRRRLQDQAKHEMSAWHALCEVKDLCKAIVSDDLSVTDREAIQEALVQIAELSVRAVSANGVAIIRQTLTPLPLADVA